MLNEWISVIPAILSQLMILFLPGFLITIQFKLSKRIILGLAPFVSIFLYRCIGKLYLWLNINFNFITVALFIVIVIGTTFVCFGSRNLVGHLSFKITKRSISILSIVTVFTLLASFQYIQQAKSPYDLFVWGDMLFHQDTILRISQDQLVQNDFIGYPVGSHILAVLNIGLTHIQITTSLIVLEFVGAVLFILGMCDLGSFIFKDRLRGVLCGGLIGLVAYTGVRYEPIIGWVFPYYFALCLLPFAVVVILRIITSQLNIISLCGGIVVVCVTIFFIHPSIFPVILLFAALDYSYNFFGKRPFICSGLILASLIVWGYFGHKIVSDWAGELKFFDAIPYTFTYVSDFYNYTFFILCFSGMVYLVLKNPFYLFFCLSVVITFSLALDGKVHRGYPGNPILAFLYENLARAFYGQYYRIQGLFIIIMGFLALYGIKLLGVVAQNLILILLPTRIHYVFLPVGCMILICMIGFYYVDTLQLGSDWSNRNLLFLSGSTDEYQRLVNDIQRERQFVYQAKRVLPENALVQIEENEGGHILRYFQDIEATPWRNQSYLDFDPDAQGVLETCALIESSSQEIFFLELGANPYKVAAGVGPNFEFYSKYKTDTILNDGVNVLYQLDCNGHGEANV